MDSIQIGSQNIEDTHISICIVMPYICTPIETIANGLDSNRQSEYWRYTHKYVHEPSPVLALTKNISISDTFATPLKYAHSRVQRPHWVDVAI